MLAEKITEIINMKDTSFHSDDHAELVYEYFHKKIKLTYIRVYVEEKIFVKSSRLSGKRCIEVSDSERENLNSIVSKAYLFGSEQTINRDKFCELWKLFYPTVKTNVLVCPCYVQDKSIYLVCISEYSELVNEYHLYGLDENNTILDSYPVLYFILKHSIYDFYFEKSDISWKVIYGTGHMVQSVKIIQNIFQYYELPGMELFQELSNMPYEGSKNFGIIAFSNTTKINDDCWDIRFRDCSVVYKTQGRVLRKFLQISCKESYLIAKKYDAYEITNQSWIIEGQGKLKEDDILCKVTFNGNSKWSCIFGKEMVYYDGTEYRMRINQADMDSAILGRAKEEVCEVFDGIYSEGIVGMIAKTMKQSHGALLVISDEAQEEANRLGDIHRAIRIAELNIKEVPEQLLLSMTAIDGAILVNKECNCYSIGTILDGVADGIYADMARGARYNSAYTYICNKNKEGKKCVAVVISEDGMVDVLTTSNINNKDRDLYTTIIKDDIHRMEEDAERATYDPRIEADCGLPW